MEGFLIRRWCPILRGCGRASILPPSATSQWGWGFHTVQGGIDPGNRRFRPRHVGIVGVWKYFGSGDGILSSSGAAEPRRCPEDQFLPRATSMSPSQSAISQ